MSDEKTPDPNDPMACAERKAFHPETPTRRPIILPEHLVADENNPFQEEQPLFVFERDLDAALIAGKSLNERGYAQMPDGFWMITDQHMKVLLARAEQFRHALLNENLGISWGTQDRLLRYLKTLTSLLPGGDQ